MTARATRPLTPSQAQIAVAKSRGGLLERDIKAQVRQYLALKGWAVFNILQTFGCHKGISDLICIRNGRVVFVELKTARGRLSEHQMRFRQEIAEHGGEYVVWRSVEDVLQWEKGETRAPVSSVRHSAQGDTMTSDKRNGPNPREEFRTVPERPS